MKASEQRLQQGGGALRTHTWQLLDFIPACFRSLCITQLHVIPLVCLTSEHDAALYWW